MWYCVSHSTASWIFITDESAIETAVMTAAELNISIYIINRFLYIGVVVVVSTAAADVPISVSIDNDASKYFDSASRHYKLYQHLQWQQQKHHMFKELISPSNVECVFMYLV